ncbi:hypothetical protein [Streptomyces sp. NPDC003032]
MEAVQVVIVGAMPWLWQSLGLTGVLVVIILIGTCDALTGLMDIFNRLTWFLGPGSAAVLLTFMPAEKLFPLDAATFAVSAVAFAWLGRHMVPQPAKAAQTPGGDADPGAEREAPQAFAVLRAHPRIGCALALSGVEEFFSTVLTIGIPIWLTSQVHAGAGRMRWCCP